MARRPWMAESGVAGDLLPCVGVAVGAASAANSYSRSYARALQFIPQKPLCGHAAM
jgi:hypothetical protein